MTRTPLPLLLAVLSGLLLAAPGCGGRGVEEQVARPLDGPPIWRMVREEQGKGGTAFTLTAQGPCRVRFRLEGTGRMERGGPWHELAAGRTITVTWTHGVAIPPPGEEAPSAAQAAEGRTEPHLLTMQFSFVGDVVTLEQMYFWTRPGKGRVVTRDLLPPGRAEPLALDTELELATLAVTDLAEATASVQSAEWRSRLVRDGPELEGDRIDLLQLFLDVEPPAGTAR